MNNKIVFMGTPDFAARHLEAMIKANYNIAGVFSQPDKISGRGGKLRPTPVKTVASNAGIPVYQPVSVNKGIGFQSLQSIEPDVIIVVAYGKILGKRVIELPKMGIYNVHASLLPRFRGAAPIQRAIECGDEITGSCIMEIAEELDAGPVISKCEVKIGFEDTFDDVSGRLADAGSEMLVSFLDKLRNEGRQTAVPQPETGATYARKICKQELTVDWNKTNYEIHNKIRSLDSVPGSVTFLEDVKVKLFGSADIRKSGADGAKSGQILEIGKSGAWIRCGDGDVLIKSVQFPGKKAAGFNDAKNGRKLDVGAIFRGEQE